MHHLPPQVRVQLNEDDYTDLRALAEKADRCTIMLARKVGTVASAVMQNEEDCEEPPSSVSAVHDGGNSQRGGKKPGSWQQKKQQRQKQSDSNSPADVARIASGLCCFSCPQPCSWMGN